MHLLTTAPLAVWHAANVGMFMLVCLSCSRIRLPRPSLQLPLHHLLALHCQWLLAATPGRFQLCAAQYHQLRQAAAGGSSSADVAALLRDWVQRPGAHLLAD